MQKSTDSGASFDAAREGNPRTPPVVGDADDVQKTTWIVGHGTDANAELKDGVAATVRPGEGPNFAAWIVGGLAVLIALVYGYTLLT